jgi:hypothetical protein
MMAKLSQRWVANSRGWQNQAVKNICDDRIKLENALVQNGGQCLPLRQHLL